MKMIKRIFAITLAFVVALCICGCGKQEKKTDTKVESKTSSEESSSKAESQSITSGAIDSKDAFVDFCKNFIDVDKYSYFENNHSSSNKYEFSIKDQKSVKYDLDNTIYINGKELKLPLKASELEKYGWAIPKDKAGNKLGSNQYISGVLTNEDGSTIGFNISNYTDKEITLIEGELTQISISEYLTSSDGYKIVDNAPSFKVCGDITEKSVMKDVISKLGEPSTIIVESYLKDGKYDYKTVDITFRNKSDSLKNYLSFKFTGEAEEKLCSIYYNVR